MAEFWERKRNAIIEKGRGLVKMVLMWLNKEKISFSLYKKIKTEWLKSKIVKNIK